MTKETDTTPLAGPHRDATAPQAAGPRVHAQLMEAEVARAMFAGLRRAPVKAGRFVVVERVGAGGMGTVYKAYDPQLDRAVALKLLRPDAMLAKGDAQARLEREAVALARLSHPNVVAIHEVGAAGGEVFLAMEYVDGADLAAWAEREPGNGDDHLERARLLLVQAGRGLAAAHRAGLVHRDVKPANVLVGDDGRVRVADFGLVHAADSQRPTLDSDPRPPPDRAADRLSHTGAVLGTPRYMSPEQQASGDIGPASDQFSFCVTAWELLFGTPPWPELPDPESPPTAPDGAPAWLVEILRRGLLADPQRRHPSMDAVVAALSTDPRRKRRLRLTAAGLLAAGLAAAAGYAHHRATLCDDGPASLARVWSQPTRGKLPGSAPGLDAFAEQWRETFAEVCDAGLRRSVMPPDAYRSASGCLSLMRVDLDAATAVLPSVPAEGAAAIVGALGHPADCTGAPSSMRMPPNPAPVLSAYREVRVAQALRTAGRDDDAQAAFDRIAQTVDDIDHPAVRGATTVFRTDTASNAGRLDEAVALAHAGYETALHDGDEDTAAALAARLAELARERSDPAAASLWDDHVGLLSVR